MPPYASSWIYRHPLRLGDGCGRSYRQAEPSFSSSITGQSTEVQVDVSAPSDAQVIASIAGGSNLVKVKSVTATIYVWRDANPNEQKQLPQIPGSHIKGGQVSRILVPVVVGTIDGNTPLNVPAGGTVTVVVELSASPTHAEDIGTATLNINGTTWSPVSVPITWIIGAAGTPVHVAPASINVAASPGQTAYSGVMIDNVPIAAKAVLAQGATR